MADHPPSIRPPVPASDQSQSEGGTARQDFRAVNKANLFGVLAAAGIAMITVVFDGCGDSGQIESIEPRSAAGDPLDLPSVKVDIERPASFRGERECITCSVQEAIETFVYDLLENAHGGWEDNEGSYGEFIFDVTRGRIDLAFNARLVASELFEDVF